MINKPKPEIEIILCAPRGFCAGVDRAIQTVEVALERYGAPVYVRHEIVHNKFVVEMLRTKGAIFIEELDEIEDTTAPVVFSAHGVPKSVPADARNKGLFFIDATCPLVSKVHKEAEIHFRRNRHILMIGHAGHPEVIGTMGQLPDGAVTLIETTDDADTVIVPGDKELAWISQTTLSVDDTEEIVEHLRARFPQIIAPHKDDICYATTNRQAAVKAVAEEVDALIVVGAPNSSNSRRLQEVAKKRGVERSMLVQRAHDLDFCEFQDGDKIGVTAGASAPESLVEEVIAAFKASFSITIRTEETAEETISFNLPRPLRDPVEA